MGLVDGFEGTALSSNYTSTPENTTLSLVTSPTPPRGNKCLSIAKSTYATTYVGIYRSDVVIGPPIMFEWYFTRGTSHYNTGIAFGGTSITNCYLVNFGAHSSGYWARITKFVNSSYETILAGAGNTTLGSIVRDATSNNVWVKCRVIWTSTGISYEVFNMNDISLGSLSVNDTSFGAGGFGWAFSHPDIMVSGTATQTYVDCEILDYLKTPTITNIAQDETSIVLDWTV